jgi:putative endonuclease
MRVKDAVGRFGEQVAVETLQRAGLVVLARNWRCADGELDIVARDGPVLVFCEVKTRSGRGFGDPAEAVGRAKVRRLRRLALAWLAAHPAGAAELRFDVVTVVRGRAGLTIRHLKGVL